MKFTSPLRALCLAAPFCLGTVAALSAGTASATGGKLTVYCSVQNSLCEDITKTFSQQHGIETQFIHGGTGTLFGRIKAEKQNPQADVWYGGTIEPHFQAAELGLLEKYRPKAQADILPQFKSLMESEKGEYTSIVYLLALGFGINTEKLASLGVAPPKSWQDLLDPRLKNEVQLPDPRSSGTTYSLIATLVQLWGEEKAFEYLKQLNQNISQYVKSTLVTANLARGESAVTVGFVHSYATEKEKGAPVEAILPQEGVGYALGGASILKGARNLENAKLFMEFVLSKQAQEIPWRRHGLYQIPTNKHAERAPQSVKLDDVKWIELDFHRFGRAEEGKRLIDKWLHEVKLAQ